MNEILVQKIERPVMELILSGDHPIPKTLMQQWKSSTHVKIEFTGVGFFIDYKVSDDAPILDNRSKLHVGNVGAKLKGLQYGVGFVLLVEDGKIAMLEGYTYKEPWPEHIENVELFYLGGAQQDWNDLGKPESGNIYPDPK